MSQQPSCGNVFDCGLHTIGLPYDSGSFLKPCIKDHGIGNESTIISVVPDPGHIGLGV